MLNKNNNNSFNKWIDKKDIVQTSEWEWENGKVQLDLFHYATKADLKNATGLRWWDISTCSCRFR